MTDEVEPLPEVGVPLNKKGKPRQRLPKHRELEEIEKGPYHERGMIFDALIQLQRINETRKELNYPEISFKKLAEHIKMPEVELRALERSAEFTNLLLRDAKKRGVRSTVKLQPLIEKILKEKLQSKDPKIQKEGLQEQREWLTLLGIKEVDSSPVMEEEQDIQKLINDDISLWSELTGGFKHEPSPYRFISTLLSRGGGINREQSDAGKELSKKTSADIGNTGRTEAGQGA